MEVTYLREIVAGKSRPLSPEERPLPTPIVSSLCDSRKETMSLPLQPHSPDPAPLVTASDPFGEPICFLMRLWQGCLEVIAGPFPLQDEMAQQAGYIAALQEDGWDSQDGLYVMTFGPNWADVEEITGDELEELLDLALPEDEPATEGESNDSNATKSDQSHGSTMGT